MPGMRGSYDTMQVCLNGHFRNGRAVSQPERNEKFCSRCGEHTIMACENCDERIRGDYTMPGVMVLGECQPPAICPNCGSPYPWTERKLKAEQERLDLLEDVSQEERDNAKQDLADIIRETPRRDTALEKLNRFAVSHGPKAAEVLGKIGIALGIEALKKMTGL